MTPLLGAHMSIANGFVAAAEEAHAMGANTLQFFLKSPRGRGVTKLAEAEANQFREYCDSKAIKSVVAHASYLLNLAKPMEDPWPLDSLIADLRSMQMLGGLGAVLHVGKTLQLDYEIAEDHLVENLKRVLDQTSGLTTHVILENTAGQGTEIGTSFEQLASLFNKLDQHERISFCLDTCHLFAAGYDLSSESGVKGMADEFDRLIGLDRVSVIHFNDSMHPLGSRKDRHQNLEVGEIGTTGLRALAQFGSKLGIPMVLETPIKTRSHAEDLDILRSFL